MMSAAKPDAALIERLERLGGEGVPCCAPEYERLAEEICGSPRFTESLGRAKALGDEHRMLALALLKRRGELCACEIQAAARVTHATVSHHMSVLVAAGLVSEERRGKWMYYRLRGSGEVRVP